MAITCEPVGGARGVSSAHRDALARELADTDVDLRDPAAADAVVDLVAVVHELLSRP